MACAEPVVDGSHRAMANAQTFVHDLDHGRQTIGGTGGRRDQMMHGRIVQLIIDPHDDIQRCVLLRFGKEQEHDKNKGPFPFWKRPFAI
jgi:hypothetical protein